MSDDIVGVGSTLTLTTTRGSSALPTPSKAQSDVRPMPASTTNVPTMSDDVTKNLVFVAHSVFLIAELHPNSPTADSNIDTCYGWDR